MKRILLLALTAVLVIVMTTACSGSSTGGAGSSAAGSSAAVETEDGDGAATDMKLGLSMATTTNLFYSKMVDAIKAACDERDIECIVTDENNDLNKQISSLENFMSMGVDAIILVAFDPEGIAETVQKAVADGIYVVAYDGHVEGAQGSLNLDNYQYGYATGTLAADWINANPELKDQEVIEVGIFDYPDIPLIIDRAQGINDALAEKAPNTKVVAQQKAGVGDEGNVQAENFLQAHPDIQVICGINDTGCIGAYEVFTAEGHVGDNIGLFGADGDEKALQLIADGTIYRGTVITGAFEAFPVIVQNCKDAAEGNPPAEGDIIYDVHPVNIDNVQEYLE